MPTYLDWNTNGSLVAAANKKKILVFDPRTKKAVLYIIIDESSRSSKFTWVGENILVFRNQIWKKKTLDKKSFPRIEIG